MCAEAKEEAVRHRDLIPLSVMSEKVGGVSDERLLRVYCDPGLFSDHPSE